MRTPASLATAACFIALGAPGAGAYAEEPDTPERWASGMEAASVSVPGAMSGSNDSVDAPPAKSGKRGAFLAVPIPRVDPALGNGLLGVAAYIFKLNPADKESPPSVLGAGALWMDGGSVGAGIGGKLYMKEDRYRITAGALYADLHYDLIVNSTVTGELSLPIAQTATGGLIHAQFRISPNSYMGARLQLGNLLTELRSGDAGQAPIEIRDQLGVDIRVNSLGPSFAYDTRDNNYYPRTGVAFDAGINVYFNELGSDISFNHYEANYRKYKTVRERDVLAWQAYLCAAGGEPPFFLQCQVGPNSLLRGYSFGVHRGDAMAAAQVEYRWQVHPRWIVAAFAGAAQVAPRFEEFSIDNTLYAGGIGLRWVVEPKNGVTLRLDYGVGEDEDAIYVSVGEAF